MERALKISPLFVKTAKGAVSVALSTAPAFFSSFFKDVNPGIVEQIWWTGVLVALAAGLASYVASRLLPTWALITAAVVFFLICFGSVTLLESIALKVLHFSPRTDAMLMRLLIVLVFASLSACVSLLLARIPDEWITAMISPAKKE